MAHSLPPLRHSFPMFRLVSKYIEASCSYNIPTSQLSKQVQLAQCIHDIHLLLKSSWQCTLSLGTNLEASCCQLCRVEAGDTMRYGPHVFWCCSEGASSQTLSYTVGHNNQITIKLVITLLKIRYITASFA